MVLAVSAELRAPCAFMMAWNSGGTDDPMSPNSDPPSAPFLDDCRVLSISRGVSELALVARGSDGDDRGNEAHRGHKSVPSMRWSIMV